MSQVFSFNIPLAEWGHTSTDSVQNLMEILPRQVKTLGVKGSPLHMSKVLEWEIQLTPIDATVRPQLFGHTINS